MLWHGWGESQTTNTLLEDKLSPRIKAKPVDAKPPALQRLQIKTPPRRVKHSAVFLRSDRGSLSASLWQCAHRSRVCWHLPSFALAEAVHRAPSAHSSARTSVRPSASEFERQATRGRASLRTCCLVRVQAAEVSRDVRVSMNFR